MKVVKRLEEFCQANDVVVRYTTFKQLPRILHTWVSPRHRARNQIDYVMVKRRWRSLLLGVKTRPSADCGSDHQLLNAEIKTRLRTRKTTNSPIRYDVSNIRKEFKVEIKNRFLPLIALWESGNEAIKGVAQETVPRKKKMKKPRISEHTTKFAEERREAKREEKQREREIETIGKCWTKRRSKVQNMIRIDILNKNVLKWKMKGKVL